MHEVIPRADSIGILAARFPAIRAALEECGIDYYCHGDRLLTHAAAGAGMDEEELRARLERAKGSDPETNWMDCSIRDLVTHLEHEHHQILRSIIFQSAMLFNEAVTAHGAECTANMRHTFRELSSALILHIEKEEHFFFPLLLNLHDAWSKGDPSPAAPFEVRKYVASYVLEHEVISAELSDLHRQSAAIEPIASDICRRLMADLTFLERQIHEYLNVENYVVFPRAIALEDDIQSLSPPLTAT